MACMDANDSYAMKAATQIALGDNFGYVGYVFVLAFLLTTASFYLAVIRVRKRYISYQYAGVSFTAGSTVVNRLLAGVRLECNPL